MSQRFNDYIDTLPEPFINELYDQNIDLESDGVEWKRIPGYDNYCVSRYGEVASLRNGRVTFLKTWPNQYGHRYVQIRNEWGSRKVSVHRLVAMMFIHNAHNDPVVRHLDDDPENNDYRNLAWGTAKDNRDDCVAHGRDFKKPVYCYELDKIFDSCAHAADYFDVTRGVITMCCQGKIGSVLKKYHLCYLRDKGEKMADLERWTWKAGCRRRVIATNLRTGEEIVYRSRQEASLDLGIPDSYISNIIAGRSSSTRGWTFRDLEAKYD